jgi:hypothetical protein
MEAIRSYALEKHILTAEEEAFLRGDSNMKSLLGGDPHFRQPLKRVDM